MLDLLASDRVLIALIFVQGLLLSRALAVTGLGERVVLALARRCQNSLSRLFLVVTLSAAFLSAFIPNVVTALALLPVIKVLIARFDPGPDDPRGRRAVATFFACALMWGANVGGNMSITGSPANLLLLVTLEVMHIPGREEITFFSWFLWGLPAVLAITLAGWLLALGLLRPPVPQRIMEAQPVDLSPAGFLGGSRVPAEPQVRAAARLWVIFLLSSLLASALSFLLRPSPLASAAVNLIILILASLIVWSLFGRCPLVGLDRPLLRLSDCWRGLPLRGLACVAGLVVLFALVSPLLERWDISSMLVGLAQRCLPSPTPPLLLILALCLTTALATEVLSNTVVAVAFFLSASTLAQAVGMSPLPLFLGVSMASTCAFMTPLATPVNALIFGDVRPLALRPMILAGLALNMVAAVVLTAAIHWLGPGA